ncbi:MAG: glycosyltransferase [Hyphomonadaceae bacterium]|nr:glycosyltransferase [Hyphomonadaceae bacterium]
MTPKPSQARETSVDAQVRVSAIVVTRDTGQPLELCLRSALAEPWIDELVIVDNGNPPAVSSALRALQADRRDVALVQGQGDIGHAAGANLGAERARGRWLLFIDPTVVVQRGAAERMVAAGGGAKAPWIVGGKITDTRGRERRIVRRGALTPFSAVAIALGLGAQRLKAPKQDDPRALVDAAAVSAVSGALMLAPRADFLRLGGFDALATGLGAELDLCRRAAEAGGDVLIQPAASGVQFGVRKPDDRDAKGLARYAARAARSPIDHAFAAIAGPTLRTIITLRAVCRHVFGVQPQR